MMDSYVRRNLIHVKATSKNCTFKSVNLIAAKCAGIIPRAHLLSSASFLRAPGAATWNRMFMFKRFGPSRHPAEKAALEERIKALETKLQATAGRRHLRRGLVAAIAVLVFASGFALGSYSDLLKQAATNLRIVLGLGGAVSDVDADNAAYGKGDYTTALRLLRPLADQNDARAQSTIGEMYYHGRGVPQDDSEAIRWFRLAAGQGSAPARFHLGVAYAGGHGVPQDYSEAAKWYRLAADQGYAPAMYNLGLAYAKGEGVSLDNVSAHMWFNLAASSFPASPPDSLQYLQRTARLNRRGVRFEIFSCR